MADGDFIECAFSLCELCSCLLIACGERFEGANSGCDAYNGSDAYSSGGGAYSGSGAYSGGGAYSSGGGIYSGSGEDEGDCGIFGQCGEGGDCGIFGQCGVGGDCGVFGNCNNCNFSSPHSCGICDLCCCKIEEGACKSDCWVSKPVEEQTPFQKAFHFCCKWTEIFECCFSVASTPEPISETALPSQTGLSSQLPPVHQTIERRVEDSPLQEPTIEVVYPESVTFNPESVNFNPDPPPTT